MSTSRAMRCLLPALSLALTMLVAAAPASARRRGPTATPVQSPEGVLESQAQQAGQQNANELRGCDRQLSRAGSPAPQASFQLRVFNGQLQVDASQNPGGIRYTSCLQQSMANAILRTTQMAGQALPYNTGLVTVTIALPYQGAPPPNNPPPNPAYPPVYPTTTQPAAVFQEQGRFVVRNVRLQGQGPSITVASGGVIQGTMEIQHNCPGCGGAINQVIVGLAGEPNAQQCVWNGGAYSRGFETVNFQLVIPNQPGTYEVRVRYAQAYGCQQGALGWWRVDRPQGPDARSTIAVVTVAPQVVQPPPVQPPVVVVQPPQQGNLLVNGGFEQPRLNHGTWQVFGALPGWQLSSGPGIEVQNNVAGRPAEGSQYVELDSHASSAIYQDVQTVPGQYYELRVAFSARPGTPRMDNSVAVVLNGQVVHTLDAEGSQLGDTQWAYQSIQFQATSSSTRVELRHVGRSNGLGGYVDDVSVTAISGPTQGRGRGRGRGRGGR
ncbi:MAG: DUF642 domain-containing protein [Myxococcales bacterium]|nr:DUF642 domain-containing protein [Myxococcales bacterium]